MAYNGTVEDYLNKEYGEAYNYVNSKNAGNYSDLFARRDLSNPIYVYNELFSEYYKDIISYKEMMDDNHNEFVVYNLPLTRYSNAKVHSGVFYSDTNLNNNIKKFLSFNSKISYDSSMDDAKLSEFANNYFNEVNSLANVYYKFRQAYIYAYVNDKRGFDNKKVLNNYKPILDKLENKLKESLDECIKLSVELHKRESIDIDMKNNPISKLIGGANLITLIKHYLSRPVSEINYFENSKNFKTEGATLISDSVYKNIKERNNEKSKNIEESLKNIKAKIVDKNLYEEDLKYKQEVNRKIVEKNNENKTSKVSTTNKVDTLEVKSVTKPNNPEKVKMSVKKKVGLIILGVTATLIGARYGAEYLNNKNIEARNQEIIEQQVETYQAQLGIEKTPDAPVVTSNIYNQNVYTNSFTVNDNARLYTDGKLQTGGSYIFQSPANIARVQYPKTIGVARYDNMGNIIDLQFVSDYNTLMQKYSEGYDLYSVLDANGIAWWNVNDTSLSELNNRTNSYTR